MANIQYLYDATYNAPANAPHCGHCGGPLLLISEHGKTFLYCKRCAALFGEQHTDHFSKDPLDKNNFFG